MHIKQIHIQNFKSLVDFRLENLPKFCAFVGPNASGKSNIFEALEFVNYLAFNGFGTFKFINLNDIVSFNPKPLPDFIGNPDPTLKIYFGFDDKLIIDVEIDAKKNTITSELEITGVASRASSTQPYMKLHILDIVSLEKRKEYISDWKRKGNSYDEDYELFIDNFSRIFVGKSELVRIKQSSGKLLTDASNLSQIMGQIFQDDAKREDFIEWVRILIPEFENIEIKKSNIDGSFEFFVYEKSSPSKPFPVKLLSDGTRNILALMAAVYQTEQPQFLCIEEPENGLHPQAIELLVEFFRVKCEENGHHIWLNTHSPTLIRCLEIDEVITVNKVNGKTQARQFKKEEAFNIKMDEAWLTNALGGGVL